MSIIVANWKMNLTLTEAHNFCSKILTSLSNEHLSNLIIAPPTIYLGYLSVLFKEINFAAQNITELAKNDGPYTGEVSTMMLSSCGVNYSIIGHYESRKYRNDTDQIIVQKIKHCLNNNITPIICIGEFNKSDESYITLQNQLILIKDNALNKDVIIAYEPPSAIGSNNQLVINKINESITRINNCLSDISCKNVKLLYGGAVNLENIFDILNLPHIAGVLIGRISLKVENLIKIFNLVKKNA